MVDKIETGFRELNAVLNEKFKELNAVLKAHIGPASAGDGERQFGEGEGEEIVVWLTGFFFFFLVLTNCFLFLQSWKA